MPNNPQGEGLCGWIPRPLDPLTIAVEHCRFARRAGQSPLQLLLAVRELTGRPIPPEPSWDDAAWALAAAYYELPAKGPAVLDPLPAAEPDQVVPFRRYA